jgi:hypothetical protein
MTTATLTIGTAVRIRSLATQNAEAPADALEDDVGYVERIQDNGDVFVERLFQTHRGVYSDNCVGNGWIAQVDDLEPITLVAGPALDATEGPRLATWTVA